MTTVLPSWLDTGEWPACSLATGEAAVLGALRSGFVGIRELAALLSPQADRFLEDLAQRAMALTRRRFGRTISLYVPLYLSNHCPGGCAYCGFASDRSIPRHKLDRTVLSAELEKLKAMGFENLLLLTGERTEEAGFNYVLDCVSMASRHFHNVTVESFAMTTAEYAELAGAGCTGITIYQETYDQDVYSVFHRWGPKRDFLFRLEAPERALAAGMRTVGLGVLFGLADPIPDCLRLFRHVEHLRRKFWQAGILLSFPRIRTQHGGFRAPCPVNDTVLARLIFAFRLAFPETPLVLSTRESPAFRDGIAGIAITRMSVASRTTVGGYSAPPTDDIGQFDVNDRRNVATFCDVLRSKGLEPVFKNWDAVFQQASHLASAGTG